MRKKILILCILSIILFASCQKTPEKEFVKSKDQELLINTIEASVDNDEVSSILYEIPETWQEQEFGTDLTIEVNAEIVLPANFNIPVCVEIPADITQTQADVILDYFCEEKPLYSQQEILTKSDYEQKILELKKNINDPNADWAKATKDNPSEYNTALENKQQELIQLEELYNNAPEYATLELADRILHEPDISNQPGVDSNSNIKSAYDNEILGYLPSDDLNVIMLHIYNSSELGNGVEYSDLPKYSTIFMPTPSKMLNNISYLDEVQDFKVKISLDEAVQIANDAVSALEIEGMKLKETGIGKVFAPHASPEYQNQFYILFYTREIEGIMQTYDCKSISTQSAVNNSLEYEKVVICVNENGIIYFEWTSPMNIVEIKTNNAPLLEFEEIKQIFKNQILIDGLYGLDSISKKDKIENKNVTIDKITLDLERIYKQDSNNEYLLVPVWNFYGYETTKYNEELDSQVVTDRIFAHSYLTINAIEGSIINRKQGY